jgi:hypothetical protein
MRSSCVSMSNYIERKIYHRELIVFISRFVKIVGVHICFVIDLNLG